jgi:hypothetical protein
MLLLPDKMGLTPLSICQDISYAIPAKKRIKIRPK